MHLFLLLLLFFFCEFSTPTVALCCLAMTSVVVLEKILVLEDPRGQIYKSLSLSLSFKSWKQYWEVPAPSISETLGPAMYWFLQRLASHWHPNCWKIQIGIGTFKKNLRTSSTIHPPRHTRNNYGDPSYIHSWRLTEDFSPVMMGEWDNTPPILVPLTTENFFYPDPIPCEDWRMGHSSSYPCPLNFTTKNFSPDLCEDVTPLPTRLSP